VGGDDNGEKQTENLFRTKYFRTQVVQAHGADLTFSGGNTDIGRKRTKDLFRTKYVCRQVIIIDLRGEFVCWD
jgi:hypothetical protein